MIGKTLDRRYKIIRELGSGGFGETFVAIDIKLHNSYCVVKKLNPFSEHKGTLKLARILFELVKKLNPFSEYRETLKLARILFERESKTMCRLDHNQIPRLLAYFEQNKNFFLVQELVQGHPLNEEIRVGEQWAVDTMVHFLASALKPLAYIHTQRVIHRDIKPANLMRRDIDGEIVLIDFGAVKEVIKSSRHGQALAAVQADIESLPSPISPPALSYLPQHKLVNTYSDDLETKPTKKVSIAIKAGHTPDLQTTNISSFILWVGNVYDKITHVIRESNFRLPPIKKYLQKIELSKKIRFLE